MLNISAITIPYDKLLARLGYLKAQTRLDAKTEIAIKEILTQAQKLIKPKAVIAFENISVNENLITFENGFKIESFEAAKHLTSCFKAYGIAVTAGSALEHKRNDFIEKKETFNALIMDAAGSVAVEEAVNAANTQIAELEAKKNNIAVKRFSPGYGDWVLETQKEFLKWLGASQIGIHLNESYQMKPEKSVSALIGIKKQ